MELRARRTQPQLSHAKAIGPAVGGDRARRSGRAGRQQDLQRAQGVLEVADRDARRRDRIVQAEKTVRGLRPPRRGPGGEARPESVVPRRLRRQAAEERRDVEAAASADDRQPPAPGDRRRRSGGPRSRSAPPRRAPPGSATSIMWYRTSARCAGVGFAVPTSRPRYTAKASADTISPPRLRATSCARSVLPEPVGPTTTRRSGRGSEVMAAPVPASRAGCASAGARPGRPSARQSAGRTTQKRESVARVTGGGVPEAIAPPAGENGHARARGLEKRRSRRRPAAVVRDLERVDARQRSRGDEQPPRSERRCRP